MSLRRQSRRERRYQSAKDWPYTPEIDGYVWTPSKPTGPSEADARWAAENLNGDDWDDIPDHVWDALAEEAAAQDHIERHGYL